MRPSAEAREALSRALEDHHDFFGYGKHLPLAGGLWDQPWDWKAGVDAVEAAVALARREEEEERQAAAQNAP